MEQADYFADRVMHSAGEELERTVDLAFQIALARKPALEEEASSLELVKRQVERYAAWGFPPGRPPKKRWPTFAGCSGTATSFSTFNRSSPWKIF
jgi:hypothetical protein